MKYTIGQVAEKLNVSVPTLRYYDNEGLTPFLERSPNGIRYFDDSDIELLNVIQCLKTSGMSIKNIKTFIEWCIEGDETLEKRYNLFHKQKAAVEAQIKELENTLDLINHKCKYYKTAVDAGTEEVHKTNKIGSNIFD